MAVLTNVSPYFDDYNEDKNFMRVLFKPGVAVQARELTQAQTILQNQVKSVGNFLFKDGSKVTGPTPSVNLDARTIRLATVDANGTALVVSSLANTYVTADNSNVIGLVEFTYEADDPMPGDVPSVVVSLKKFNSVNDGMFDENTVLNFYTDYTNALIAGTPDYSAITTSDVTKNAISTTSKYSTSVMLSNPSTNIEVGDLLVHPSITKKIYVVEVRSTLELIVNEAPGVIIGGENISYVKKATCPTCILTQDTAVFYKYGFFVKSLLQKIVPDKNTAFPTKLISLLADQQIITSDDDTTLLDPALESSNYLAPGADRLKVDLNISAVDLNSDGKATTTDDIIPLIYFNKGKIEYVKEVTLDNTLDRKLAERTYDESGSYVVDTFQISPVQTSEANAYMRFSIGAGKAYVGGEQVRTVGPTEITVAKPSTTETKTSYNINTIQGNYYKVANVSYKLIKSQELAAKETYLELHNTRHPTGANSRVGVVAFKNLYYDSSDGSSIVSRLYINNSIKENEVPATWAAWATKYGIDSAAGQYVANILYTNNDLLGNYGAGNKAYYGLFREPDTAGVAYWYNHWASNGKDIAKTKEAFAIAAEAAGGPDAARVVTASKSYAEVINYSPFYDGLVDVKKVRSIVGVANEYTSYGTSGSYATPFFYADIANTGINSLGDSVVYDQRSNDKLVFPTYKNYVKTAQNIKTEYIHVIQNAIFAGGIYTKTLSSPETFVLGDGSIPASTARTNFTVLVKSGATANIPTGLFNFERGTVTVSGSASTLTINTQDAAFTGLADIAIRIQNDNVPIRSKTLVSNFAKFITIDRADHKYTLRKSDIHQFKGVYKLPTTGSYIGVYSPSSSYNYNDVVLAGSALYQAKVPTSNVSVAYANAWTLINPEKSSYYNFDNGQRDLVYDHGGVTYTGPTSAIPGDVVVIFDYFTHSGTGPITVESYPLQYSAIPKYTSVVDSKDVSLRDALDFRPRRKDDFTYDEYQAAIVPAPDVTTEIDITYFLGRKDRIYVTNSLQNYDTPYNKFFVETGVEEINPKETKNYSDLTKLSLAVLELPPYVNDVFDVKITYDDNKRYTMRDIGKIDDLTVKLDKAVKLHSIEIANIKSIVINDQGDVLLKSGILVESFADMNKADLTNGYFSAIIDTRNRTCFPSFNAFNLDLEVLSDTDIAQFSELITMKYTEELLVSQLEGNSTVNPNPGGINNGRGRGVLTKKNSLLVNLMLTGGVVIAGMIAAKTIAAYEIAAAAAAEGTAALITADLYGYAAQAAAAQEGALAVAWGAAKDAGLSVVNAFKNIDIFSKQSSLMGQASSETVVTSATAGVETVLAGTGDIISTNGVNLAFTNVEGATDFYAALAQSGTTISDFASVAGLANGTIIGLIDGIPVTTAACLNPSVLAAEASGISGIGAGIVSAASEVYLTTATAIEAGAVSLGASLGTATTIASIATPLVIAVAAIAVVDWISEECYITTAVCKYDNKPDDCEELMELRKFRNRYMLKDLSKDNIMHEYYNTAPYIVSKIEKHKDKDEIYKTIRDTYIKPAVIACKEMNDAEAERIYTSMMTWVKNKV